MREAALEFALRGDEFAPSLFDRLRHGLAARRRARLANRHLRHLRRLDARLLDDLGLTPDDLADLDPSLSSIAATRRLAEAAGRRRTAEERWLRV